MNEILNKADAKTLFKMYLLGFKVNQDMVKKAIFRNFPRNKARQHRFIGNDEFELYKKIYELNDQYHITKQIKMSLINGFTAKYPQIKLIDYNDKNKLLAWLMNEINSYHFEDLVYGDFILNPLTYIYNGYEFVPFEDKRIRVLDDGIKLDYWYDLTCYVYIDIRPFREQMLSNLENNETYFIKDDEIYSVKIDIYQITGIDIAKFRYHSDKITLTFIK